MSRQKTKPIVIWEQVLRKDAQIRLQAAFNLIFGILTRNNPVNNEFDSFLAFNDHVHA